mmetsp:Transcript_17830/g.67287  ORF Transcript_17830/g.67287 Transcript_17830/m.67287 type:complete len:241 (-) Transcript_17830:383-1105(-)
MSRRPKRPPIGSWAAFPMRTPLRQRCAMLWMPLLRPSACSRSARSACGREPTRRCPFLFRAAWWFASRPSPSWTRTMRSPTPTTASGSFPTRSCTARSRPTSATKLSGSSRLSPAPRQRLTAPRRAASSATRSAWTTPAATFPWCAPARRSATAGPRTWRGPWRRPQPPPPLRQQLQVGSPRPLLPPGPAPACPLLPRPPEARQRAAWPRPPQPTEPRAPAPAPPPTRTRPTPSCASACS